MYNYWHLFWTFSYVAFLFHFYWAVFVIFKGVHGTFAGQGNLIGQGQFGVITGTYVQPDGTTSARQIQVALKIIF